MTDLSQILPRNPGAEHGVLSAMLSNPNAIIDVVPILGTTHEPFFDAGLGIIYEALVTLDGRNVRPDAVILRDYLASREGHIPNLSLLDMAGGPERLDQLAGGEYRVADARQHAEIVRRDWALRRLIRASGEIARMAYAPDGLELEEILAHAEELIYQVRSGREDRDILPTEDIARRVWSQMERQIANPGYIPGWRTGITNLDRLLGYLEPGRLVTMAGRPGMGKTAAMLQIAYNTAVHNRDPVIIFSHEMSEEELTRRLVAIHTGISITKLRMANRLSEDEVERVHEAVAVITRSPLTFGRPGNVPYMRAVARRWAARQIANDLKPAAMFVDYLQLVPTIRRRDSNRNEEIGEMSRTLKLTAQELNVVVYELSQLNRSCELRNDKRPLLSDLRESGNIEQDSDVVAMFYRDVEYQNEGQRRATLAQYAHGGEPYEIIVRKWRDGQTGTAHCIFYGHCFRVVSQVREV